jgi:hypothetical protein
MTSWVFEDVPAKFVQQNPTQRDQFNNDEVGLAEALVREVIQNSTDASDGSGPVKVCFSIRNLDSAGSASLRQYFASLRPHLQECGVSDAILEAPKSRVLVIEDFATRGLTGDPAATDSQNFHNFWRVHGGSEKRGTSGGRWGLGKLVFSSSSEVRAFFGLTVRFGETVPLLMGQAVLKNHKIGSKRHPAHGFWFSDRGPEDIQLPVTDAATVKEFKSLLGVARDKQPGLSVIIPYLKANIDERSIIDAVLRNYYFPILAGKLSIEVGATNISQQTFHAVAAAQPPGVGAPIALPFVEAVSKQLAANPQHVATSALNGKGVVEKIFPDGESETMKASFRSGKLLHVRVPVALKRISGEDIASHIDLYLQSLPQDAKPFCLYARGAITVPGETRYFSGVQAYGAMVAADNGVTEFLGDAENPAHTNWIGTAEKLAERWKAPADTIKRIRYALSELYAIVGEKVEHEDQNALLDLFSIVDAARGSPGLKKRSKKPEVKIVPREKVISIKPRNGGFEIVAGPGAAKWKYPKNIRVRIAYDTMVGNPFTTHSKYDFDLTKNEIKFEAVNGTITADNPHTILVSVTGPDFSVSGSGFDTNRDIVVDARAP